MKRYIQIAQMAIFSIALAMLSLSCKRDENPQPEPQPQPQAEVNRVSKVVLRVQIGHLHGAKSFHYLPSEADLDNKNLEDEQLIVFKREGQVWKLTDTIKVQDGSKLKTLKGLDRILVYRWKDTSRPNPLTGELQGGAYPQYGILIEAYDEFGRSLNLDEISKKNAYQYILYPSGAKDYDSGKSLSPKSDYSDLMGYVSLDTDIYNKSAHRGETKFRDSTDPVNYKGYAIFPMLGSAFDLNIDLYATTHGKLDGGKPSPFYAPNATVKQGSLIAHLSVPLYVFAPYSMKQYAATDDIKVPLRPIEKIEEGLADDDDQDGEEVLLAQAAARRLVKILGKPWEAIGPDFTYNKLAPRANERTGGNFY